MTIDIEKLRADMRDEQVGAAFGGGFFGAMVGASEIDSASPEKLIRMAQNQGIDLRKYEVK